MAACKRCVLKSKEQKKEREQKRKMEGKMGIKRILFSICAVVIFLTKKDKCI